MTVSDRPLVSVVLPSYNRAEYVGEAIASALGQELGSLELVIVDDASRDPRVDAVIRSFDDPRIVYVRNTRQLGVAGNMRKGFSLARGRYAAILCDDDAWESQFLAKTVPLLEADPNLTLVFSDYSIIDETSAIDPVKTEEISRHWRRNELSTGPISSLVRPLVIDRSAQPAMAAVFRRSAIDVERFAVDAGPAYDLHLAHQLVRAGGSAYYVNERLTRYRVHSGALTAQRDIRWLQGAIVAEDALLHDELLLAWRETLARRQAENFATLGNTMLRRGEAAAARPYLFTAMMMGRAALPRALAGLAISFLPSVLRRRIFGAYDEGKQRRTDAARPHLLSPS